MIAPRDYQQECLDLLNDHFKTKDKALVQLPTGAGKTIVFLKYLFDNNFRSLIICPTIDLQNQIYESALMFFDPKEICIQKKKIRPSHRIVIICIASLKEFEDLITHHFDLVVFDEAHKSLCNTFMRFLSCYTENFPKVKVLGLTATPERSDGDSILDIFEHLIFKKNIVELVVAGHLCDIVCYRIKTKIDLECDGKYEDFRPIELRKLDCYSRNKLIYDTYFKYCLNKKTLIFCLSVEHAEKMADYLREEKGIKAYHISGLQSKEHRKKTLLDFKEDRIDVLLNCQLLTEGFDEPSIQALIIARPTKSKSLYCQMIGRATRKFPGKEFCEVHELTDNNHNICTFNVCANEQVDRRFQREYRNGISLTELSREIETISLSDYILEKEEVKILHDFSSFLRSKGITVDQKEILSKKKVFFDDIDFMQANFMIFLDKLKVKYGYNRK